MRTVQEMGWAGRGDAEVMRRAAQEGFELLIANDKNIRHQQSPGAFLLLYELPIMNWPLLRDRVDEVVREVRALLPERRDLGDIRVDD